MKSSRKDSSLNRNIATILGIKIDSDPTSRLLKRIGLGVKNEEQLFVVTPNPEIITRAQEDNVLMDVLNSAEISVPDATGIVVAARVLGLPQFKKIPGRKFMIDLFNQANEEKRKVYLLGSSDAVISTSLRKIKTEFPYVKAEGSSGPILDKEGLPISEKEREKEKHVISEISQYKPDYLFIAFGSPKQEKWWNLHKDTLKSVHVAMVVGGSLDYYSGSKKYPPALLDQLSLEWLWRLLIEPGHVKRVFVATIVFPLLVLKSKFFRDRG